MPRRPLIPYVLMAWAVVLAVVVPVRAQTPVPDPTRFKAEIDAFRQWDTKNAVPRDGVLFVGSSSIRLWPTAERFPDLPVINRGFGGSQISDVNHYINDVVLKYRPAVVVFYAGENDINAGRTPEQVVADYQDFVSKVLEARPDTRIVFLPMKPSLARWTLWPTMQVANARIQSYSRGGADRLFYVDTATPMLTADGQLQPHLYVDDGLHMTAAGYDIWTQVLIPVLAKVLQP